MSTINPVEDFIPVTFDGQIMLSDAFGCPTELAEGVNRLAIRREILAVECRSLRPFVTDELIEVLCRIPTIRRLEFAYQPITDMHIERLMTLPDLKEIHIVGSDRLTTSGRRRIQERPHLVEEVIGCPLSEPWVSKN